MLQQTRVDQARPYFERFMASFPTVSVLASEELDAVLKHWEGLGYYSRARNIHAAANIVREHYGGYLPDDPDSLRQLPGIGPYTAGAISSIAFGRPVPAVDGNVVRVLSRLFMVDMDTRSSRDRRDAEPLANRLVDPQRPGDFNQSLMELGATICTPYTPACSRCPVQSSCMAYRSERVDDFPVRVERKRAPIVNHIAALAINGNGKILMVRRPTEGLLGGLWEVPQESLADEARPEEAAVLMMQKYDCTRVRTADLGTVRHAYSHFKVSATVFRIDVDCPHGDSETRKWMLTEQIDELATTGITKKMLGLLTGEHPQ